MLIFGTGENYQPVPMADLSLGILIFGTGENYQPVPMADLSLQIFLSRCCRLLSYPLPLISLATLSCSRALPASASLGELRPPRRPPPARCRRPRRAGDLQLRPPRLPARRALRLRGSGPPAPAPVPVSPCTSASCAARRFEWYPRLLLRLVPAPPSTLLTTRRFFVSC